MIDLDLDEAEYHSHPSLSATGAKILAKKGGAARFKYEVLDGNRTDKKAFDLGSAVHAKVLGVGAEIVELEFDSFRTKDAREARDEAYAAGLIPILSKDLQPINDMAEAILGHLSARALLEQDGNPEASVFAHDDEYDINIRCRFDFLPAHREYGVDLKTVGRDASPGGFAKQVAEFGYEVQESHYGHTIALSEGIAPIKMAFIAVEVNPPYLVGVYKLPEDFSRAGDIARRRAYKKYAHGMKTGEWPGYPDGLIELVQPVWHQYKTIDEENEELNG